MKGVIADKSKEDNRGTVSIRTPVKGVMPVEVTPMTVYLFQSAPP